jgi:hypothetical protein
MFRKNDMTYSMKLSLLSPAEEDSRFLRLSNYNVPHSIMIAAMRTRKPHTENTVIGGGRKGVAITRQIQNFPISCTVRLLTFRIYVVQQFCSTVRDRWYEIAIIWSDYY